MMNRTAEALFWIGRYMERAENHTRLMNVNYHMRQILIENEKECNWERLISSIGDIHLFRDLFEQANEETALQFLTFASMNENSLFACVSNARNNVRTLRQLLPSEVWESMNGFYLWLQEQNITKMMAQSPYFFFQRVNEWLSIFNGTADSTMVRDHTWHFIQAGKFFERAENSMRVLDSFYLYCTKDSSSFTHQANYNRFIILLKSAGGYEAFRKVYADNVTFAKVIEFLISDPTFPHSVKFSLASMETYLTSIKQQDYQFHILAEKATDFVKEVDKNMSNLHADQNNSKSLKLIHEMLESINHLGFEISKTFFQEEFVGV